MQARKHSQKQIVGNWKRVKEDCGNRHSEYLEKRMKRPTSKNSTERLYSDQNRSPRYLATIGGIQGWGQNALSPTDTNGSKLIDYIVNKLRKMVRERLDVKELMVMKKLNGVHIMVILRRLPGTNLFEIESVAGKQGEFDGINGRTAPFSQIVKALFHNATFKITDIPDSLTHLCLQAELMTSEENSNSSRVCNLVFAYERADSVEEKCRILKQLKLVIFNVCGYEPARGIHAEKVNNFPPSTVNAILVEWSKQHYKPEYNPTGHCKLYTCPRLLFRNFDDEEKDAVSEFYRRHSGGEGFITSFYYEKPDGSNGIDKTKSKVVYPDGKALALEVKHSCLGVLLPLTGGSPVGIVCFVPERMQEDGNAYKTLIYTEFKPVHDEERGFAYKGSTKWSAADLVGQLFEDTPEEGKLQHRRGDVTSDGQVPLFVRTRSGAELRYTVPRFPLLNYDICFLDLGTIDYLCGNDVAYAYKCNEIIATRSGVHVDTHVFMGLILDYDRDFILDLLEKARGTENLTVSEITHLKAITFKDLPRDPELYSDLFEKKLTKFHVTPQGRLVEVGPFYKVLEAQRREDARGAFSSPPRRASHAQSSRSPGTPGELQALKLARCHLSENINLFELALLFEQVGTSTDRNLGRDLAYLMQSEPNISRGDKARITRFYNDHLLELKEIARKELQDAGSAGPAPQPMPVDNDETQEVVWVDDDETQATDGHFPPTVRITRDETPVDPPAPAAAAESNPEDRRRRCLEAAMNRSGTVRKRSESPVLRCVFQRTAEPQPSQAQQQAPLPSPILTPPRLRAVSARERFREFLDPPPPPPQEQEEEENWEVGAGIPPPPPALRAAPEVSEEDEMDLHI